MSRPGHQILRLGAVHQFANAVVTQLKTIGQFGHRRPLAPGKPLQRQQ
jgi:hypothetical protein